ncbi:TPA: hypothetical protein ACW71V_003933 [Klebsiella aerogenes]
MSDEIETIDKNPKSWAAWKREAERLQEIIDGMALVAMDSEPVMPEEIPGSVYEVIYQECGGFVDCDANAQTIWNACRAAMLQAEPVTTANKLGNSPVIPDGWKLVPVEPNGDMLAAAQDAYGETDGDIASTLRAAIAAAPQEVKP